MTCVSKNVFLMLTGLLCWLMTLAQRDYASLVNPFIGTGAHGHTYPGASMPFGMVQLSADTRMANWDGSSGYHYSDSIIYGFSHTHLSGTGIPDYCDLLFMPFKGKTVWEKEEYHSGFSHKNEKASPGYYEVMLDKHQIRTRLTTTARAGMHQYEFPGDSDTGKLMIDLTHRDELLDAFIEKVSDHELRGYRRSRSWAQDQVLYFHIISEQKLVAETLTGMVNGRPVPIKMVLKFEIPLNGKAQFKTGLSAVSMRGAELNLRTEMPGWDFSQVSSQARKTWNQELGRIDVKGGTRDQQVVFYTALYHSMLAPNIYNDVDGNYRGTDKKIHRDSVPYHTVFSLWDTYRALHPLMTIINRHRTSEWIQTFLRQYRQGGMLPVWELAANETFCMIGYHAVPVITDAWRKGIRNFDEKLALEAMLSYAESNRFGLDHYRQKGYISNDAEHESVSKTLEYAFDDWCIAQIAKDLGRDDVYRDYISRSQYYKNLFDPQTRHMRGKLGALFYDPFDAKEINNFFTEANSWQYSFAVPHDLETLIELHGGTAPFAQRLNELFSTTSETTGRQQADVTGLIGQYAHGNEPSHHMAYIFNYLGMPWRTQELVHRICNSFYSNTPEGLIGNEDCGQMSAWYVFSAIGFYPVNPAEPVYVTGTPVFDEVTIHLENGKKFQVRAKRKSPAAFYVQSMKLNGKPHTRSYFHHNDIMNGGILEFELSETPDMQWASTKADLPASRVEEARIVAVPFFMNKGFKFRNEVSVSLKNIDSSAVIYYRLVAPHIRSVYTRYEKPFTISFSCEIEAMAFRGKDSSKMVSQYFHKIPNEYSIEVLSEVHPMYTAGGPESLIDGLKGNVNWRTGSWQSYFDQDFEAIVDLKEIKDLSYLGIHVLQDVSPWIVFPKEVLFYTSQDGKDFEFAGSIQGPGSNHSKEPKTLELGISVSKKARFIRIKALSGGPLPQWHESAGNPSHLFIDEVSIR